MREKLILRDSGRIPGRTQPLTPVKDAVEDIKLVGDIIRAYSQIGGGDGL